MKIASMTAAMTSRRLARPSADSACEKGSRVTGWSSKTPPDGESELSIGNRLAQQDGKLRIRDAYRPSRKAGFRSGSRQRIVGPASNPL